MPKISGPELDALINDESEEDISKRKRHPFEQPDYESGPESTSLPAPKKISKKERKRHKKGNRNHFDWDNYD